MDLTAAKAQHKINRAALDDAFKKARDSQEKVRQLIEKITSEEERENEKAEMRATDIDPINSAVGHYKIWTAKIAADDAKLKVSSKDFFFN